MRSFSEFLTASLFSLACFWECNADDLNRVRERGELVWAADQEGGAPYVFSDTENPSKVIGFEVEPAEMVAGELGVKARFQRRTMGTIAASAGAFCRLLHKRN